MTSSAILSSFVPLFSYQTHHYRVEAPLQWWRTETGGCVTLICWCIYQSGFLLLASYSALLHSVSFSMV